ncbi:MAG: preprotein translocase subunit SecE [Mycobacteriaceae bacterium]|nr:preprotein translocase subunit SecE [Mycobacteriaceae bacterium]
MSDERGGAETAGVGSDPADIAELGGQTAVATKPVVRPQRPTGKRSRQQAGDGADASAGGPGSLTAVNPGWSGWIAKLKKIVKAAGPVIAPIIFVYNYLKQVVAELRKVIWPSRKQMLTYTSVVLVFLAFMVALVGLVDLGLTKLVLLVFS